MDTLGKNEFKIGRTGVVATVLWAFGIFIIGLATHSMITWEGGVINADLQGILLIFVSLSIAIQRFSYSFHFSSVAMRIIIG